MVTSFSLVATTALAALASAQAPANCAAGVQVCGTTCCTGPATAFGCENGVCVPAPGVAPPVSTSVILVTTSPAGVSTEAPNTTVSVPVVSPSETTIVATVNVTSFSTTVFPTGNHTTETNASHTHTATGTSSSDKPEASGAAGILLPGTGVLGAAVAAALGVL